MHSMNNFFYFLLYKFLEPNFHLIFRRYIQTMFHVINWFRYDIKPGSPSWKSVTAVRKLHVHASMRCQKAKIGMISQKDMALTQFGFMG